MFHADVDRGVGVRRTIGYAEASDLIVGLMRDPRSHLRMSMLGLKEPASVPEVAVTALSQRVINFLRGKNDQPFTFELFVKQDPNADVTAEMRAELVARLDTVSAFPGFD